MRISKKFFTRDVLEVAPDLLGKFICRKFKDGSIQRNFIVEVEAYRGEEDMACHARFGKTRRNQVMYEEGGKIYVYLIYGMYWMLNIVTGGKADPQAVLIRGVEDLTGPGRVGKWLLLDKSFYGEDVTTSKRLWIEQGSIFGKFFVKQTSRIGVDYAGEWAKKPWRFVLVERRK
ncbi:MAG: DNA-3-methyladenine glycosylase [Patescibacteria group bacterium]|nr:DNA-3-methyladenine glycosylase [Patescibacteria group bacterium]